MLEEAKRYILCSRDKVIHLYMFVLIFFLSFEPFFGIIFTELTYAVNILIGAGILCAIGFVSCEAISKREVNRVAVVLFFYLFLTISWGLLSGGNWIDSLKIILYEGKLLLLGLLFVYIAKCEVNKVSSIVLIVFFIELVIGCLQLFDIGSLKTVMVSIAFSDSYSFYRDNVVGGGVFGTFMSKNTFGYFSLLTAIVIFFHKVSDKVWLNNFYLFLCFFGVVISESRTALFFLVFIVFLEFKPKYKLMVLISILFSIFLVYVFKDSYLPKSISEIISLKYYQNVMEVGRGAYLLASVEEYFKNPLMGGGAGNWGLGIAFSPEYKHNEIVYTNGYNIPLGVFQDNNWISILIQYGLFPTFLFVFYWFLLYRFDIGCKYQSERNCSRYLIFMLFYNSIFLAGFTTKVLVVVSLFFIVVRSVNFNVERVVISSSLK